MNSTAATPARSERPIPPPTGFIDEARAAQLKAANINPRTGLATDYLNHFNEAVMLLEMVPDMPECAEDFLTWAPLSYAEHFWASNFKARDLAIEAYEAADPKVRTDFDNLTASMTSILTAVGAAMREAQQDKTRATLAEQAAAWVKPLVALAGGVINGNSDANVETVIANHQNRIVLIEKDPIRLQSDCLFFPDHALVPSAQPTRPQLAVSGAIFRDGKILLVRRSRSPGKGFYSFPGGRVEFGESLHTALHREVDEETGLRVEILGLAGWREVLPANGGGGHYLIMSFAARWTAREPVLNDEHDDFKWLAPEAIGDLKVTGGLLEVIEAARRLI